jgi:RNA polymerase sigma factor (sigma-70 family)
MKEDWETLSVDIHQAALGDKAAQDRVTTACLPHVKQIVHKGLEHDFRKRHRWIMPLFSTQDIVHEVLVAVIAGLEDTSFDNPEMFYGYLSTVVRHRILDAVRFHEASRRDSRKSIASETAGISNIASPSQDVTPTLAASIGERASLVREALDALTERHRIMLEMRLMQDATFPQIKDALGYSSDETARQAFHAAQAKFLVKLRSLGIHKTVY